MENTSDSVTLSNIHSDICVDSGCTDQKLKMELDQMISKRRRKNKHEFVSGDSKSGHKKTSDSDCSTSDSDSSVDDSSETLERMRHRNTSSSVSKHLSTSSLANDWKNEKKEIIANRKNNRSSMSSMQSSSVPHHHKSDTSKDSEQDKKIAHIDHRYEKISKVTKDTRGDVLRILLILQKLIDDSRAQKQRMAKLEIKIKELDDKVENQSSTHNSTHSYRKTTSGTSGTSGSGSLSEQSDFNPHHSSSDRDHRGGNFREYELKFDRFKQEVNTEIIKINNALVSSNNNFEDQITSVRSQLAQIFGLSKKGNSSKCC